MQAWCRPGFPAPRYGVGSGHRSAMATASWPLRCDDAASGEFGSASGADAPAIQIRRSNALAVLCQVRQRGDDLGFLGVWLDRPITVGGVDVGVDVGVAQTRRLDLRQDLTVRGLGDWDVLDLEGLVESGNDSPSWLPPGWLSCWWSHPRLSRGAAPRRNPHNNRRQFPDPRSGRTVARAERSENPVSVGAHPRRHGWPDGSICQPFGPAGSHGGRSSRNGTNLPIDGLGSMSG
jgi:hypothetical protein